MRGRIDPFPLTVGLDRLYERSELEISRAVKECARLCLLDDDPHECAREYVAMLIASGWSDDDAQEVLLGGLLGLAPATAPTVAASVLSCLEGLARKFIYDPPQSIAAPHMPTQCAGSRELPFACLSTVALGLGAFSLFAQTLLK